MTKNNDQVKALYEEAIYWHLIHQGKKVRRKDFKVNWSG